MKIKKWRCTVCNYIHLGDNPPEKCPECGFGSEYFEFVEEVEVENFTTEENHKKLQNILFKIQYGLYVVSSHDEDKLNGQICNTLFQITSSPLRVAIGINQNNLTHEYIKKSNSFSVCILGENCLPLIERFGYKSGREVEKYKDIDYELTALGNPMVKDCVAQFECKVVPEMSIDAGTHTIFIADVVAGKIIEEKEGVTYSQYRQMKKSTKENKSTDEKTKKWECQICGYIHEGENPPESCPVCGVGPEEFKLIEE